MYIGNDLSRGRSETYYYTSTSGGETAITTDTSGKAINYTVGWVSVYLNGVRLHDSDFTATSGNSITGLAALSQDDVVIIEAQHTFSSSDAIPSTGGTFSGNVSFGDNNITNVGSIALDSISADGSSITLSSNTTASGNLTVTGNFTSVGIDDNADATAITIDSNEGVGIRATPESWGSVYANLQIGSCASFSGRTNEDTVMINNNAYMDGSDWKRQGNNGSNESSQILLDNGGNLLFRTAGSGVADSAITWSTKATILNGGNVGVGTTTPSTKFHCHNTTGDGIKSTTTIATGKHFLGIVYNGTTETFWVKENGDIYYSGSQSSDRKMKENIVDSPYGLAEVLKLNPRQFNFIGTDQFHQGFIAQETESIVPNMTNGDSSEEAEENMSFDYNGLTAVLVKAVQELSDKNDALEAENTALKTRMDALEARVTALENA